MRRERVVLTLLVFFQRNSTQPTQRKSRHRFYPRALAVAWLASKSTRGLSVACVRLKPRFKAKTPLLSTCCGIVVQQEAVYKCKTICCATSPQTP